MDRDLCARGSGCFRQDRINRRARIEPLEPRTLLSGGISGTVYRDLNADGQFTPGEPPLAGWTVYLDANRSGARDAGEASTTTDANGQYSFGNLAPGTYYVAEETPLVWKQASPTELGARLGATGVPQAGEVARAMASLTTTRSTIPIHLQDAQANALIGLDSYQSDTRFSRADGRGYSVAVLDTGADLDNPAFGPDRNADGIADRIVYQHDFADNDNDASDHNGHGTNVASIAAGQDGMAPGANLIILKVFSDSGAGDFGDIESALQWCVANAGTYNIASVNMSLGDSQNWNTSESLYGVDDELAALSGLNVIVSSAAGNDYAKFEAQGVSYPAADPNSLAVGAVWDGNDGPASWVGGAADFSTGPDRIVSFSQRSTALSDIFAPGAIITGAGLNGGTSSYSGTSQASPHIAGITAWAQELAVEQLGRRLSFDEFRQLLRSTSVTIHDGDDEDDNVVNTGADFDRVQADTLGAAIYAMGDVLPYGYTVNVQDDQVIGGADFGNQKLETRPTSPDLMSAYDSGLSDSDNLTLRNNAFPSSKLEFQVNGLFPGAQVGIYSDGTLIGSGTAGGNGGSLVILTDGSTSLTDGTHSIAARQTAPGDTQSLDSEPLNITIDTIAPSAPGMPDMQSGSDSGISSSDNITNIRHPKFDVTTAEGGLLELGMDFQGGQGSARQIMAGGTYDMESVGGGNAGFLPAQRIPAGNTPYALTHDDINHDGNEDVLLATPGSGTVGVYFGDGAGGFGAAITTGVPGPYDVKTADFDHDGQEDIVVTSNSAQAYVLFGDGTGRFSNPVSLPLLAGNYVLGVTVGDVNRDGNMDVIADERGTNTLRVILGNGNRTFRPGVSYPAGGNSPYHSAVADMNNDGNPDLLAANNAVDAITVLLGNGNGTFQSPLSVTTGDNPTGFFVGDYDRDGRLDVVVTENGAYSVQFFRGNGDGTLTPGASARVYYNNGTGVGGDFNGDGLLDYATTADGFQYTEVDVLYGAGDGTLLPYQPHDIGESPFDMIAHDFNGDGLSDLVVADYGSNDLSFLVAKPGGLRDGNHLAYATLEDAAGNVSSRSPTLSFTIDTVAPTSLPGGDIFPNPRETSVLSIDDVAFSEPVAGFDPGDLSLSRDGAIIPGPLTLDTLDEQSWRISALDARTGLAGQYLLDFGSEVGVTDLAGNPLAGVPSPRSWIMDAVNGTGADDQIHLVRGGNDHTLSVKVNGDASYTVDLTNLDQLHVNASTGDDAVNLDLSGGGLNFPGGIVLDGPAASNGDVLRLTGGAGDDSATFSGVSVSFNGVAITLATSPRVAFVGGTGNDTFTLSGGTQRFAADASDSTANLQLNVESGATAIFDANQHLAGLAIDGGNTSMSSGGDKVLVTGSLSISSGGKLDLNDNDLVVRAGTAGTWTGAAYDGITGMIGSGAIFSSSAQTRTTTPGIAPAGNIFGINGTQTATFDGQTVSASDVLIKFTYAGDANLDGKINIDDYGRIDGNVGQSGIVFGWYNGDFNFDGKINIDDYGLIDSTIGAQGPVL